MADPKHQCGNSAPGPAELVEARALWRWTTDEFPEVPTLDRSAGIPPGHGVLDRPLWLIELVRRMVRLAENFLTALVDDIPRGCLSILAWLFGWRRWPRLFGWGRASRLLRGPTGPVRPIHGARHNERWWRQSGRAIAMAPAVQRLLPRGLTLDPALGRGVARLLWEWLQKFGVQAVVAVLTKQKLMGPASSMQDFHDQWVTLPKPRIASAFRSVNPLVDDAVFAGLFVQGNNPVAFERVQLGEPFLAQVPALGSAVEAASPRDKLAKVLSEGRLYWARFPELLPGLKPGRFPQKKWLALPTVFFVVPRRASRRKPFRVVGIRTWDELLPTREAAQWVTPADGPSWQVAKSLALTALTMHSVLVNHFPRIHMVAEILLVAMKRQLPAAHALHQLLESHFDGTVAINTTARSSQVAENGAYRMLLSSSLQTNISTMRSAVRGFAFESSLGGEEFRLRGVDDAKALPYYPFRDDTLRVWEAHEEWASAWVDKHYRRDRDVANDPDLQNWVQAVRAKHKGELTHFTDLKNKSDLSKRLAAILHLVSSHHAAIQFPLNGFDVFAPATPGGVYRNPAEVLKLASRNAKDWEKAFLAMLPPLGVSAFQLAFNYFGDVLTRQVGDYTGTELDPQKPAGQAVKKELRAYRRRLRGVDRAIRWQNLPWNRFRPYVYLRPRRTPHSVDI